MKEIREAHWSKDPINFHTENDSDSSYAVVGEFGLEAIFNSREDALTYVNQVQNY